MLEEKEPSDKGNIRQRGINKVQRNKKEIRENEGGGEWTLTEGWEATRRSRKGKRVRRCWRSTMERRKEGNEREGWKDK